MPEVEEVFRMATQKVRPDPGAIERQNRAQRRRNNRRKAGVYVLVACLTLAVVVIRGGGAQGPEHDDTARGHAERNGTDLVHRRRWLRRDDACSRLLRVPRGSTSRSTGR